MANDGRTDGSKAGQPGAAVAGEWPPEAWHGFLAGLPRPAVDELLADAHLVSYPAGSVVLSPEGGSNPALVVRGTVMAFVESPDGRRAGLGYAQPGEAVGIAHLFNPELPVSLQAVADTMLAQFNSTVVKRLAESEPAVANAVAAHLSERLGQYCSQLRSYAFATARERLATQLLARAVTDAERRLVVRVSHQQMADAIGCVREHVARLMSDLRAEGLVTTGRESVVILNEDALSSTAVVLAPDETRGRRGAPGRR